MVVKKKAQADDNSAPCSVFSTLFGGVSEESVVSSSIFSESNPLKRKHQSQSAENESIVNPENSDSLDSDISELKERKKTRKEKSNFELNDVEDEATRTQVAKKSRKVILNGALEHETTKEHSSNFDSKIDLSQQNQNINLGDEGKKGSEKERKKRKRHDVEKEYIEKKFGVTVEKEEGKKVVVGEKRKKAEDMLVQTKEEGFDDEDKLLKTIFIGNLPLKVKKKALLREFSKFGEIDSVRIRSVPMLDTKVPRKGAILQKKINDSADSVHAYIVFISEQSTEAALAHNTTMVGGNHIRVDRACPPRKKLKGEDAPLYDNKRTVFVGNLPFDVKDEEIYQLFCGLKELGSSVEAVRIIRHPRMRVGKGIAYVLFKTREAAILAGKRRNLKLRYRELRLSRAQQNSTPSKRKDAAPAVNSPAKKFACPRTPGTGNMWNSKAAMSYQGLRASKSGTQKKVYPGRIRPVRMKKSRTLKGEKPKVRQEKRPSVALKKASTQSPNDSSTFKRAGLKRKQDGRTPDVSQRKKARRN